MHQSINIYVRFFSLTITITRAPFAAALEAGVDASQKVLEVYEIARKECIGFLFSHLRKKVMIMKKWYMLAKLFLKQFRKLKLSAER